MKLCSLISLVSVINIALGTFYWPKPEFWESSFSSTCGIDLSKIGESVDQASVECSLSLITTMLYRIVGLYQVRWVAADTAMRDNPRISKKTSRKIRSHQIVINSNSYTKNATVYMNPRGDVAIGFDLNPKCRIDTNKPAGARDMYIEILSTSKPKGLRPDLKTTRDMVEAAIERGAVLPGRYHMSIYKTNTDGQFSVNIFTGEHYYVPTFAPVSEGGIEDDMETEED